MRSRGRILVAVGALLLLNNLGCLDLIELQRYWPIVLIVAGAFLTGGAAACLSRRA